MSTTTARRWFLTYCLFWLCPVPVQAEHPIVSMLREDPGVHAVTIPLTSETGPVIVHIRDWHWVPYEYVLAEGGSADNYLTLLEQVEQVQAEQYPLLKKIVAAGHTDIFGEAITPDVVPIYRSVCRSLWKSRRRNPDGVKELFRAPNVLSIGAPGRLLAEGLIERIHATESDATLKLTHPLDDEGHRRDVSSRQMEQREDYMVRQLLKVSGVATIVLGGGHDLADNVRRMAPGEATLVVVTTRRYQRVAGD